MAPDWKTFFFRNSLSAYLNLGTRMVVGVLVFRRFFTAFDAVEFGFWSLLWSIIAFSLLLDFGLGLTVQKNVAQRHARGDIEGICKIVATVFWMFAGIGIALMAVAVLAQPLFFRVFEVPPEYQAEFMATYRWFFLGMALLLPLAVFPEILNGLQRIYLHNWSRVAINLAYLAVVVFGLEAGWGPARFMLVLILLFLIPNTISAVIGMKLLGRFLIHPRYFDFAEVRPQLGFSVVTYLVIIGNFLLYQTDQFIIGSVIGVAAIAAYQSAFKISELLIQFGRQLEGLISPAAARMHALDDHRGIQDLFFRSSRLMFVLGTPLYLFAAFFLSDIIRVLTGLEEIPRETWLAGQFLLAAVYSNQLSSACARRVMIMTGREKMLLGFVMGSAFLNLGLSVVLGLTKGIAGVALATLISNLVFGWGMLFPRMLKHLSCQFRNYFKFQWEGAVNGMAVFLGMLILVGLLAPSGGEAGVLGLAWRGVLIVLPAFALNFAVIRSTWEEKAS